MIAFLSSTFLIALSFVVNVGAQKQEADPSSFTFVETGQTVIMGTWNWDIETNSQGPSPTLDVWWQQVNKVDQFLVPKFRTSMAVIKDKSYELVDVDDLFGAEFAKRPIRNTLLTPGTVLAMKTTEGNFAKIKVIGYRDLHDFSFVDARFARESWKYFIWNSPNRPNYHLEIEWTLYRRPDAL